MDFLVVLILTVSLAGSEDKFLRKYAMTKMYENCFGIDVIKQIRQELREAVVKCASSAPPLSPVQDSNTPRPENSDGNRPLSPPANGQQPILVYRPNPPTLPPVFYRPPYSTPFYNQGFSQMHPNSIYFSSQFPPYAMYGYPMVGPPLFNTRVSRDMTKTQLDIAINDRIQNSTCVMQQMGYLDQNWEPNYDKILDRIASLPIAPDLKGILEDGVNFCQQFVECIPSIPKSKPSFPCDLIRPMTFFKCYKLKKIEACITKGVRDKLAGATNEELETGMGFVRNRETRNSSSTDEDKSMDEFLYGNDSYVDGDIIL